MFAWLAKEEDYKANDPVGKFLSENGDLKTVAELQQEMSRKTDTLITSLTSQISAKSKYLMELECKCNQMDLALQRAMEDNDSLDQRYNEGIPHPQSLVELLYEWYTRLHCEYDRSRNLTPSITASASSQSIPSLP